MNTPAAQRIGLFGGTFDPVHHGHLRPAIELAESFELNTLHLIPNHRPAHRDKPTASTEQRIEMLRLAVEDQPRLQVDTREALRDKSSYTFDTLTEYRHEHPTASLVFFMGVDAFSKFDTWHRWQDILKLANLVVVDRPNAQLSDWAEHLVTEQNQQFGSTVRDAMAGVIERTAVTQLAISATDIRRRIGVGQSIDYLVPNRVKQYIVQNRLYRR